MKYISNTLYKKYLNAIDEMEYILEEWELYECSSRGEYIADALGLEHLGSGSTRTTLALDDNTVVKFCNEVHNSGLNKAEVKFYETASPRLKDFLAQILEYDKIRYDYIVMERGDAFDDYDDEYEVYRKEIENIRKQFKEAGILIADTEYDFNFVVCNGVLKLCDYAEYELLER